MLGGGKGREADRGVGMSSPSDMPAENCQLERKETCRIFCFFVLVVCLFVLAFFFLFAPD